MTEYTVTAIRYTFGKGLSHEEGSRLAKEFIKSLKVGMKVILEAEPNNPADENAVAVYVRYKLRGYIAREQCLEVRQFLDENEQADAVVSRNDENLAFFVTIPGAAEREIQPLSIERQLPESPLGKHVRMPFSTEEKTLDMLAKKLTSLNITKEAIPDFVEMVEHYLPLLDMSICYSDEKRLSFIFDRLKWILNKKNKFELSQDCLQRIQVLHEQLHARVRAMHRRWKKEKEKAFISHLNCLRMNTDITSNMYEKYCEAFLESEKFTDADKKQMQKERERLLKWFREMEWIELRNPKQLEKIALKLTYLRVSRQEIYDVFSVLLVLEQLDECCNNENLLEGDELVLPKDLDTRKARKCFARAIKKQYMEKADNGKYRWIGTNNKGNRSELAYFCGKVYGYKHTISGNVGESFPEDSLNKLFGVTRLYSSLTQVYSAQKIQKWRRLIDEICE